MYMLPQDCSKNKERSCRNLLAYRWAFEWAFNDKYAQQIIIVPKMKVSQIGKGNSHNTYFKTLISVLHLPERLKCSHRAIMALQKHNTFQDNAALRKNTCKYSEHSSHHKNPIQNSNWSYVPNALHPEIGLSCSSGTRWKQIITCDPREKGNFFLCYSKQNSSGTVAVKWPLEFL